MTHRLIIEYKTEEERSRIKLFRLYCWMNGNKTMKEVVMEMIKEYNQLSRNKHLEEIKPLKP